jgi:site-specific DNA recombinase
MHNQQQIIWAEYNRRSSDEKSKKQNVSLDRQHQELEEKFPSKEYPRPYHFQESQSAFKPNNREKFNELVQLIETGEVTGLIVYHPNRLSRNSIEAGIISHLITTRKLLDIKFASYTFDNSAEGMLLLQFALSQSQYESTKLSLHVHSGNKYKFHEKKEWGSFAKQGYVNYIDPITRQRDLKIDEERFYLLQQAGQKIISGELTPLEALDWLNEDQGYRTRKTARQGGNKLSETTFYSFLSSTFYYGLMRRKVEGKAVEDWHKYPTMFTKEEWDLLQIRLGKKSRSKQKKHTFPYKNMLECGECAGVVTAEEKWQIICPRCKKKFHKSRNRNNCTQCGTAIHLMKNPTVLHYIFYHCTKRVNTNCSQGSIEIKKLEKQIESKLSEFEIHPRLKDWLIDHVGEVNELEAKQDEKAVDRHTDNYQKLKDKLRRLTKIRFEEEFSKYSEEEQEFYESEVEETKKLITESKDKIDLTDERQEDWLELSKKTFEFATYARHWFEEGDLQTRLNIVRSIGSNLKLLDKEILLDRENPYWMIKKAKKEAENLGVSLEPTKIADVSDLNTYLQPAIPTLLRD